MRLRGVPVKALVWIAPPLYLGYMRFVFATSVKTFHGFEPLWARLDAGENALSAAWHQDAMLGPYMLRKRNIVTMASLSRDGELFAKALRRCGYAIVRGSSSRRGPEAVRELAEYLKPRKGCLCALAADGPHGPARRVKRGIAFLAKHTGARVYPIRCGARRRIINRSWDQMTIPLPFNELVFHCGEPVYVDRKAGKEAVETARAEIEQKLNELSDRIDRHFGRT